MDRRKIGIIVTLAIALFSVAMIGYSFAIDDYQTMMAYVIAFSGWLLVLLDEAKPRL